MIISKHFLIADRKKAEKRISFMRYCLNRSNETLLNGEIDLAEIWIDEYSKCINELKEMMNKKKLHDYEQNKLQALAEDLKERGINVSIVYRYLGGVERDS